MSTMVRRDSLKPGDVAVSSHYGKSVVESATQYGTEGQTTEIVWANPESWKDLAGKPGYEYLEGRVRNERYDSHTLIELVFSPTSDLQARVYEALSQVDPGLAAEYAESVSQ